MNFGMRLENLIEEKNVTQKALSTELHIAHSTLNGYVKNHRKPDLETIIRLAKYFDVSTDYMLGLSKLKQPISSELTKREVLLISIYRCLLPEEQKIMIELAEFYQKRDNKQKK